MAVSKWRICYLENGNKHYTINNKQPITLVLGEKCM